ncbi:MAG: hypothetical protein BYD32DRAFT_119496, partial [Podila humilis]
PRRRHLHRACQAQDRHLLGCRLRPQAPGTHPLRFRRINILFSSRSFHKNSPFATTLKHTLYRTSLIVRCFVTSALVK